MNQIQSSFRNPARLWLRMMSSVVVWGPGLLVMLADTDVGNVVTAAQGGARWGYRLLPILLSLIPLLYAVQELAVRLGIITGRGQGELIREKFGVSWAAVSAIALTVATVGSTVTEFTGLAGVGEIYGLPRGLTLSAAATTLLCIAASGFLPPDGTHFPWHRTVRAGIFSSGMAFASEVVGHHSARTRSAVA